MENTRNDLAEKLEIIGKIFEIDGMSDLLGKFERGMNTVKFSAVIIQVSGLLLKENKEVADRIIAMHKEIKVEEVHKMEDSEYATALRDAIITDVLGFFGSSPHTDGKQ